MDLACDLSRPLDFKPVKLAPHTIIDFYSPSPCFRLQNPRPRKRPRTLSHSALVEPRATSTWISSTTSAPHTSVNDLTVSSSPRRRISSSPSPSSRFKTLSQWSAASTMTETCTFHSIDTTPGSRSSRKCTSTLLDIWAKVSAGFATYLWGGKQWTTTAMALRVAQTTFATPTRRAVRTTKSGTYLHWLGLTIHFSNASPMSSTWTSTTAPSFDASTWSRMKCGYHWTHSRTASTSRLSMTL